MPSGPGAEQLESSERAVLRASSVNSNVLDEASTLGRVEQGGDNGLLNASARVAAAFVMDVDIRDHV